MEPGENIAESEIYLKGMFNHILEALIVVDRVHKVIFFNDAASQYIKEFLDKTVCTGTCIADIFPPQINASFLENLARCFSGETITTEYTFLSTAAKPIWLRCHLVPVSLHTGIIEIASISFLNITAEKNALAAQIKSENLVNAIFEATATGICVTDENGIFVQVNPGYARLYGYAIHELIGQPFTMVVVPEQRGFAAKLHDNFIAGEEEMPGEWQVLHKNGRLIDIYASASLLVNPDGSRYKVTTVLDITETKRYKNLLIYTQRSAKTGGWEIDLLHHTLTWTEEVYNIYGLPVGEPIDVERALSNYTRESQPVLREALEKATNEGTPFDLELQFFNEQRDILWVKATCEAVRMYDKVVKLFGTFQDITARRQAEDEIKKLSLVASKTSNGVLITDKNGMVEWVNEGFEKLSGYSLAEIKSQVLEDLLVGPATNPKTVVSIKKQQAAHRDFTNEILYYHKDGTPYWVNINFSPVFDHKHKLAHYIAIHTDISERIRREQQLRFQATILDNVRDSVIVTDLEGIIVYWNEGARQIFGYSREEAIGQSIHIINPAFNSHQYIINHLAGKNNYGNAGIDWQTTRKDGSSVWVNAKVNPVLDENNQITGILGVAVDITERKQAEEQLRKTEASLKAIFETSPNAHFLIGKDLRIISFNKVAAQYIRHIWKKDVQAGDSMLLYSNPPDTEQFLINFQKCLQGELIRFERKINFTNGPEIWFEITYMPVQGNSGGIEAISFSSMDITGRKMAEQQQKETNKTLADFRYAITSASIVSIADAKGNITYTNENFIKISQYSKEELLGQNHRIINSGHHPKEFFTHLWKEIAAGNIWRGEIRNRAKDGSYYWVDTFIIPFLDEKGKPLQYLSIRNDITNRKQAEEILIQKNKELEKTNAELDRFVYSASHNLRAPLTSIMGLLNIIDTGNNPEYYLSLVAKSVTKLDDFIKDIVNYSKNSRLELDLEPIDLEDLLNSSIDELRFMKDVEKIHIRMEVNAHQVFYSDKQRLKMVFGNLLSNAFKYHDTSRENPYVQITVQISSEHASVIIQDNGQGIAKEHHEKLFHMFYRATTKSEGSGLGLYIVKEIIEKLGGHIRLESEPGQGTSFYITLPNLQSKAVS